MASPTCMLIYLLSLPFMFCMHYLSLLLSLSVTMHFIDLTCFQLLVDESGQPWPGLCLHQGCIAQSGEGRLTFLSRFAHSYPALTFRAVLHISRRQWLLGPRNCANLSLGQQSFPAGISHYAIPTANSQYGLHIAQI